MSPARVAAERAVFNAAHRLELSAEYARFGLDTGPAHEALTAAIVVRDRIVWHEFVATLRLPKPIAERVAA